MVYFDIEGDNDFASIFQSVAREKEEADERKRIEEMIEILDQISQETEMELEEQEDRPRKKRGRRVEHYKVINEDGDIQTIDEEFGKKPVNRKKVHTLDDLPRESEWEQIFGPQPEEPPLVDIQVGRRLRDGEKFYTATMPGSTAFAEWKGISFGSLLLLLFFGLALIVIFTRVGRVIHHKQRKGSKDKMESQLEKADFQRIIYAHVDRRMYEKYTLSANDFI